jgi:hypothetical protein
METAAISLRFAVGTYFARPCLAYLSQNILTIRTAASCCLLKRKREETPYDQTLNVRSDEAEMSMEACNSKSD